MLTYTTKLIAPPEDLAALRRVLEWERDVFNIASKEEFPEKRRSIIVLHNKVYKRVRKERPEINPTIIVCGERACLAAYRNLHANDRVSKKPIQKKNLSLRLGNDLYNKIGKFAKSHKTSIRIKTPIGRKVFTFTLYSRLQSLLNQYSYCDPLLFVKNGDIHIALSFNIPAAPLPEPKLALGVDMGGRVSAAISDGRLIIDKKFAKEKRRLRFLKRQLRSAKDLGSRSAKRHIGKMRQREPNKTRNQVHLVANAILKTDADTIVLENLKGIKATKNRAINRNRLSQIPFFALRTAITHKAGRMGKHVTLVCPSYTSQTDSLTGKREGERRGRRFYAKSGLVYDSDINAACNIAKLSKLPFSGPCKRLLDGQASVSRPIVDGSHSQVLQETTDFRRPDFC